jgi:CDP-glycerol glycerophosphotransferase (TagB/SpsB family)/glycosyltransferase involved in cell wall biosynthesis
MLGGNLRARIRGRERLRGFVEERRSAVVATRYARWRKAPVDENAVLYESFFGNGMLDHPEAIFRYLLDQPDLAHLRHTWVLDDCDAHPEVTGEFAEDPRVRFVEYESPEYLKAIATSKYLVNNSTFPQELAKRPEQVYLNTWHGVPLKHMGFDMPNGGVASRNITRNFLNADYLLSANPYMTDTMYRKAYRLQGIFRGAVIEEGQPRIDRQLQAEQDPQSVVSLLESRGVEIGGRQVVLYAPTWRGETFQDPHVNASQMLSTVRHLQRSLDPETHVVLLKVHQVIYNAVRKRMKDDCTFLVPNSVPTNLTLGIADVLVTDYSSIFFDFLASGRPVVHYVPDLDEYRADRGLYLDEEDLPGPVCSTPPDLAAHVREALEGPALSERTKHAAATYTPYDDGSVTERVVNLVFRGHSEDGYRVRRDFGTDKETLLIYLGGMKSMGITTSALNLLKHIDYDRYDVTAYYAYTRGRDRLKNAALVDPRVRVIPRALMFNASPRRVREETKKLMVHGLPERLSDRHLEFWRDEWRRMFGSAQFDHLIDFSGYGCFSPFLFTACETGRKSIWLHNDMMSDMQRETIGEKHLEDRLSAVFTTYRYFDHLVSVSPELNRVNAEKLTAYARPEQFTYAVNTMDGSRVLEMAAMTPEQARRRAAGERPGDTAPAGPQASFDTANVASAVRTLLEHFDPEDVLRETRSRLRLSAASGGRTVTFVSVGRLSPEKNHARLIRAFARVHERHPEVRLVILGGGKLESELRALVVSLGLEPYVRLAGQVDNPYSIMAEADCFVLSSDYEGQPMVILEARTLGLPVVTTAFASVGDSVPEDAGIVVPQTVAGVAGGMERFLKGEVPAHTLDYEAYNAVAMEQFYAAIGSRLAAG